MLDNPVGQSLLKTNIAASFFRFQPLMAKDLVQLSLEFFVERRILNEIIPVGDICRHMGFGVLSVTNM